MVLVKPGRNDVCWCGSGKKYKKCHALFDERIEAVRRQRHPVPSHKLIKTPEQIEKIKESAKINIAVLDRVAECIGEGMTTGEIDRIVYEETTKHGGIPAPLNFEGYPKSVCTSVNEQVCHGIPSDQVVLTDGDIVNVDVSTNYHGFFSDSSRMFLIGNVSEELKRLSEVTKEAVYKGFEAVKPWGFLGDVGAAVHDYVYDRGFTIVKQIGGHGVGLEFHEEPWVGYHTKPGTRMLLVPGMMFTIEPMVNLGKEEIYIDESNGWTVYTEDGKPSAQWEIQVVVTEDGAEIISY